MRGLIILLLVLLNPFLLLETSKAKTTVANYESEILHAAEKTPRLVDNSTTISWIKSHQKKDGGYGRLDSFWSHGSWTYAAIHALTLINKTRIDKLALPDNASTTVKYVKSLGMENGYVTYLTSLPSFENIYTLNLLGSEPFNKQLIIQKLSQTNLTLTSSTGWWDRRIEEIYYTIAALKLLNAVNKINYGDIMELVNWLKTRQNSDGGWDNIGPDDDPFNLDGTSYVTYTWYAAMTLSYLNVSIPNNETLVKFIQSCQNNDGGFGNRPDGLGSSSDIYYTFAAIQTLGLFGEKPINVIETINWINRLQNNDGGFGDKPLWNSRLYSTYYAIHSLIMLNVTIFEKIRGPPILDSIPATYHIFSYGMEVSGYTERFSSESVLIADDLGLDLIGLKTDNVSQSIWANEFAEYYNLSTRTVLNTQFAAEEIHINGLGKFSYVSDILYPPDSDHGGRGEIFDWEEYKNRIKRGHGNNALFCIGSHTRDFDYLIIDDSIETLNGYDLIIGSSFYSREFVRQFPWFERWIGKIPMVANSNTDREFWEQRKQFETVRTFFIALNSTWDGFKEAVYKNRVVIVFKTADTPGFDDVVLYGSPEGKVYLQDHSNEWIWWGSRNSASEILITPITHGSSVVPDNSYEWDLGNFTGTILRIKNDTQFVSIKIDGQKLNNLTFINRTNSYTLSSFFYIHIKNITNGTHYVEVDYVSQNGLRLTKTIIFDSRYPSLYLHELSHFPADPTNRDPIIVKVTVIERIPVKHIILWYSVDEKVTWNTISMNKDDKVVYSAVINKMMPGKTVYYFIKAVDITGHSIRLPWNDQDYANFEVSYQRSPKEYIFILTISIITIVSVMSFLAEIHWKKKSRKHF